MTDGHPLAALFADATEGRFPPSDGTVRVLPPLHMGLHAIVSFTGHVLLCTDRTQAEVDAVGPDAYGGTEHPSFVQWFAGPGGWVNVHDAVMFAWGTGLGGGSLVRRDDLLDHERARYARDLREDVSVFADDRGVVTIGRGVAGRREMGFEVHDEEQRGRGTGTAMLRDVLGLLPAGATVFAQVAPANARSLRVLLRAGFVPICSEILIRPVV